jgi:hypothetical protein
VGFSCAIFEGDQDAVRQLIQRLGDEAFGAVGSEPLEMESVIHFPRHGPRRSGGLAASKFKEADNPPFEPPIPFDPALGVVQHAPVAHDGAALGRRNDLTKWGDTVSSWP